MNWIKFSIISFSIFGCAHRIELGPGVNESLLPAGVVANLSKNLILKASSTAERGQVRIHALEFYDGANRFLKVRRTSAGGDAQARGFLEERLMKTLSIYRERNDPYFQAISNVTICPENFQIVEKKAYDHWPSGHLFFAFANDRNELGACTRDAARKKAIIAYFLCGKDFLEVEMYVPTASFNANDLELVRSFACKP